MVVMTRRFVQMTIVIPLNASVTTVGYFTHPLFCNDQRVLCSRVMQCFGEYQSLIILEN